jgi:signal transduction histidine kinase/ligand-binding sensor domain-containing protein
MLHGMTQPDPPLGKDVPHFFEKLTTQEGLSSNTINDIEQDENGFLWIATSDGLNRFDGTEVRQFFKQHNSPGQSLTHNYVFCLQKLPGNYLAIGTQAGLSFYDGNTGMFENFYHTQNKALDEYNNTILSFAIDSEGNLWAASRNCIFIFSNTRKLKKVLYSSFTGADAAKTRLRFVDKMFPLAGGYMLFCFFNGWHIYSPAENWYTRVEYSSWKNEFSFLNEPYIHPDLRSMEKFIPASHLFQVFDSRFLCIRPNKDSLFLLDERGRQEGSCFFAYNKYPFTSWSQKISVLDSARLVISFHNYGLAIMPVTWRHGHPVVHQPDALLFDKHEYGDALRDRQGNWWLATVEEGLQKFSPYKQNFKSNELVDQITGEATRYEVNTTVRYGNKLWVSTYGDGFFEVDPVSGAQQHHRLQNTNNDTWSNFIWNIRQVHADTFWIGTQNGLFWYIPSSKKQGRIRSYAGKPAILDSVSITTQFTDSRGWIWMGLGRGKGLCSFDPVHRRFTWFPGNSQAYPLRYPTKIAEDSKGNLWLVNDASTLLTYRDKNRDRFQTVSLPPAVQDQLSNFSAIWCDGDSVLWLGTIASGLIKFNHINRSAIVYGHDKGLGNSHISSIYEDDDKRLWLATDGELACFDKNKEIFTNYFTRDGLPVKYPTAHFYYDRIQKKLYSGGNGVLFYFDPSAMNRRLLPQKTIITAMQVNGQPYMLNSENPKFKAWQNDITVQYTSVDLTSGPGTKYAYKLIGEDTGWIMAGNQRQINFSRLAPGRYTFLVRASNIDGVWSNESAGISFFIRPPFTQTIWFYMIIALGMAAVFYAMYRFRLRQLMRTEQVRSEISKNLHDEVGSTLTNISLGSLLAQKQLQHEGPVTHILDRIYQDSQTVSEAMREIVWSINPRIDTLGESLPRMLRYASELLEAKDIELKAQMTIEAEQVKMNMQERRDLYLVFKETLNNLVKHSLATEATIDFHIHHKQLVMSVSDNGKGFDKDLLAVSNGLKNMQERAQAHHWQLLIHSVPGSGTTILLKAHIA